MQNPLKKVCEDDDDSNGGISIYNIGGVFIVIFVGIGLAIVTLVIEYWCVLGYMHGFPIKNSETWSNLNFKRYYKYKKPQMRVDSATDKKLQVKQVNVIFKNSFLFQKLELNKNKFAFPGRRLFRWEGARLPDWIQVKCSKIHQFPKRNCKKMLLIIKNSRTDRSSNIAPVGNPW